MQRQCPICERPATQLHERCEVNPKAYDRDEIRAMYRRCGGCGLHFYDLVPGLNDHGQIYQRQNYKKVRHAKSTPAPRHHTIARLLYRLVGANARGMEVGAGSAHPSKLLAAGSVRMYALDTYYTEGAADGVHYLTDNLATPARRPELDGTLDFVIADNVLEHLPALSPILERVNAWLKPGGYFFVIVPNRRDVRWLLSQRFRRGTQNLVAHVNAFDDRSLGRLMAQHGMRRTRLPFLPRNPREVAISAAINGPSVTGIYKIYRTPAA